MKNRRQHQPLTKRSLKITAYHGVQMWRYVAELDICAVLQIPRHTPCRTAQLRTENDLPLEVKTVARCGINRIRTLISFYITGVHARKDLVLRLREHLACIYTILFGRTRTYTHERQEVADLVVREGRDKTEFVERYKRVAVSVR